MLYLNAGDRVPVSLSQKTLRRVKTRCRRIDTQQRRYRPRPPDASPFRTLRRAIASADSPPYHQRPLLPIVQAEQAKARFIKGQTPAPFARARHFALPERVNPRKPPQAGFLQRSAGSSRTVSFQAGSVRPDRPRPDPEGMPHTSPGGFLVPPRIRVCDAMARHRLLLQIAQEDALRPFRERLLKLRVVRPGAAGLRDVQGAFLSPRPAYSADSLTKNAVRAFAACGPAPAVRTYGKTPLCDLTFRAAPCRAMRPRGTCFVPSN